MKQTQDYDLKIHLRYLVGLTLCLATAGAVRAQVMTASLSATFTNPTPATTGYFGYAVTGVGTDRFLIGAFGDDTGAPYAGAAYLFSTNGVLLTGFTNPNPASYDYFGNAMAAVGTDKVFIAAMNAHTTFPIGGAAYLFSTNGTLLTTITNPAPTLARTFGSTVAAVGVDNLLVGAPGDNIGDYAGMAFLFNTAGALVKSFTNPTPAAFDYFGQAISAVGTDKILIGATGGGTGKAHLFSTNGTLLTTFTNPAAGGADQFGVSVASLGDDRVIIGAYGFENYSGVAYLFRTNGAILTTFTNPNPASEAWFGITLASVAGDRVLIGACYDDTGVTDAGAAYLFDTNGTMLCTFTNPTPASHDNFGYALAVVNPGAVLIGAFEDDTQANYAGAAYLYGLSNPAGPPLSIKQLAGGNVRISWQLSSTSWVLDQTAFFNTPPGTNVWSKVPFLYQTNATEVSVTASLVTNQFYRLRQP